MTVSTRPIYKFAGLYLSSAAALSREPPAASSKELGAVIHKDIST